MGDCESQFNSELLKADAMRHFGKTYHVKTIQRVLRGRVHLIRITANTLLTCPEFAALRECSVRWVYELLRREHLKASRRGGHRLISAREVLKLCTKRSRLKNE